MCYKKAFLRRSKILTLLAGCFIAAFSYAAETTDWMGSAGAVLLQGSGALGFQAFNFNLQEQWTDIPENAYEWQAVAMDESQVLFFYAPAFEMAVCTLDETGAPSEWLPINGFEPGFSPVALEKSSILLQGGPNGELLKVEFDADGAIVDRQFLWQDSLGWKAQGMDANRIVLQHAQTGDVAIWAVNPVAPLFRPYRSFKLLPGWEVRDFAGDLVLVQQGHAGTVQIVELGDGYEASRHTELNNCLGWHAAALAQKL